MATATRIYVVTDMSDGGSYLVRAAHPAQAINRIVRNRYLAESASQEAIIEMMGLGATVIDASEPLDTPVTGTSEDSGQASLLGGDTSPSEIDPPAANTTPIAEAA